MNPLILIALIVVAGVAALCGLFFGIGLLHKWFGQERVERYLKMRTQGPFVPAPEERTKPKT